jgi:hypothetical protein
LDKKALLAWLAVSAASLAAVRARSASFALGDVAREAGDLHDFARLVVHRVQADGVGAAVALLLEAQGPARAHHVLEASGGRRARSWG